MITWTPENDGMKEIVHFNDKLVGYVKKQWSSQKWSLIPYFSLVVSFSSHLDKKFDTAYEAGKALVKLYEAEMMYEHSIDDEDYYSDIEDAWDPRTTQPIDMRKMWSKP